MQTNLHKKLAMVFVSLSLVTIVIISIIANVSTGIVFRNYITAKQNQQKAIIQSTIVDAYSGASMLTVEAKEKLTMYAMLENLKLTITDYSGRVLWVTDRRDDLAKTYGTYQVESPNSHYIETQTPILYDGNPIGTVISGFSGGAAMTSRDLALLSSFNRWLVFSGLISIFAALSLSLVVSSHLSLPIQKVTQAALSIKDGNLSQRLAIRTGTAEIDELAATINHLAESLDRQETMRKQLTADVAHELRTPLAILQSQTEAILDGLWEPSREKVGCIHGEIMRLSYLVNDLGKLTQIESELAKVNPTTFDLTELLTSISASFAARASIQGIGITISNPVPVRVFADRDKLSQVIVNLVANALKYTNSGGHISLEGSNSKTETRIRVSDTGVGIAKEHLPFIFERFYRVDSSRSRSTGGTGLGLAIADSIIKAHAGRITVTSRVGQGTEFTVILPRPK